MYKRILIPLDRSKLAEEPLGYGIWLANKSGAELVVMNVCGPQDCACEPEKCVVIPEARSYIEEKVVLVRQRLSEIEGRSEQVKSLVVAGDPATEILRYVEEQNIDLVIMATHGRSGIKRWLIGSVADKVVRNSSHPVRLIKSFSPAPDKMDEIPDRSILVLLDGSELAEEILPYASYHANLSKGELKLLNVCAPPDIMHPIRYHLLPDSYPPSRPVQWDKYAEQEASHQQQRCRLYLDRVANGLEDKNFKTTIETLSGNPADEIVKYLENNPVNLVAMTTRGRSGLNRWVFGSVAEKVLISSPSPILIVKSRQKQS